MPVLDAPEDEPDEQTREYPEGEASARDTMVVAPAEQMPSGRRPARCRRAARAARPDRHRRRRARGSAARSGGCRADPSQPGARRAPHRRRRSRRSASRRVYIALKSQISTGSLGYAVFFFALYLVAHVVARFTVPLADPYLLPMAALLTAIGRDGDLPARPEQRVPAGALGRDRRRRVRRDALLAAPRLPRARALQVRLRRHGDLPALPAARARDRGVDQRLAALDPLRRAPVPAGRAREDRADRLPRRVPPREARGAGAGKAEGLGAAARDLGRRDARPLRRRTTSAARSSTTGSSSRCSTSRPRGSRSSPWRSACSSSASFVVSRGTPHVRERVTNWLSPWSAHKVYCPLSGTHDVAPELPELPARAVALLDRHGGFGGTGLGRGIFTGTTGRQVDPRPEHRLHLLGARAGARAGRRGRRAAALHGVRRCAASRSRSPRPTGSRSSSRPA